MSLKETLEKIAADANADPSPLTDEQIGEIVVDALASTPPGDMVVGRDGQLMLPTGVYFWSDKTYRVIEDPNAALLDSDDDDENE